MTFRTIAPRMILAASLLAVAGLSARVESQERNSAARSRGEARPDEESDATVERRQAAQIKQDRRVLPATHVDHSADAAALEDSPDREAVDKQDSSAPVALSPRRVEAALPLARPGAKGSSRATSGLPAIGTTLASLAVVLALFFGTAWVLRRGLPRGSLPLPADVVEVLGRAALPGKQQMHLIKCGNKLLLVWATPNDVRTLSEITDPVEVDRLTSACREAQPGTASSEFKAVFQQLAKEPVRGFLEPAGKSPATGTRAGAATAEASHA